MGRCEGYYRLENHRCDRQAEREVEALDGLTYLVCGYHGGHPWQTSVARWQGETGLRASAPARLRETPAPPARLALG